MISVEGLTLSRAPLRLVAKLSRGGVVIAVGQNRSYAFQTSAGVHSATLFAPPRGPRAHAVAATADACWLLSSGNLIRFDSREFTTREVVMPAEYGTPIGIIGETSGGGIFVCTTSAQWRFDGSAPPVDAKLRVVAYEDDGFRIVGPSGPPALTQVWTRYVAGRRVERVILARATHSATEVVASVDNEWEPYFITESPLEGFRVSADGRRLLCFGRDAELTIVSLEDPLKLEPCGIPAECAGWFRDDVVAATVTGELVHLANGAATTIAAVASESHPRGVEPLHAGLWGTNQWLVWRWVRRLPGHDRSGCLLFDLRALEVYALEWAHAGVWVPAET